MNSLNVIREHLSLVYKLLLNFSFFQQAYKALHDATSQQSQQVHCGFPAPPHTLPKSEREERKSFRKLHTSMGMFPVNAFPSTLRSSSLMIVPNSLGTLPVRLLPYIHSRCMFVSFPSSVGIVPLKLFSVMDQDASVFKSPISDGMVPPNDGFLSIQTWKIRGIPTIKSRPPVIAESSTNICSKEFS